MAVLEQPGAHDVSAGAQQPGGLELVLSGVLEGRAQHRPLDARLQIRQTERQQLQHGALDELEGARGDGGVPRDTTGAAHREAGIVGRHAAW